MPRYKSRLGGKTVKKTVKKVAEKVKEEVIDKVEEVKDKTVEKVKQKVQNKLPKKINIEKIRSGLSNARVKMDKLFHHTEPANIIHALELSDSPSKTFHYIKEVARQAIGEKSKYHPKYTNVLKKNHELFAPMRDIARNAKNMSHLIDAVKGEINDGQHKGGSVWSSIGHSFKSAGNFIADTADDVYKGAQTAEKTVAKGLKIVKPIAQVVDTVGELSGMGSIGLSSYVDDVSKGHSILKPLTDLDFSSPEDAIDSVGKIAKVGAVVAPLVSV